jgi:flagellar basal-body rod protein FlgB
MPSIDFTQSAVMQVTPKALDAASLRHLATMSNIANAGNPLHVAQRVQFEAVLRSVLAQEGPAGRTAAAAQLLPRIVPGSGPVAIDQEVAALARNTLHYQALLKTLNAELELLGLAANDGRR